jgi:hypothetical protein
MGKYVTKSSLRTNGVRLAMFGTFETCHTADCLLTRLTEDIKRQTAAKFVSPVLHDDQTDSNFGVQGLASSGQKVINLLSKVITDDES